MGAIALWVFHPLHKRNDRMKKVSQNSHVVLVRVIAVMKTRPKSKLRSLFRVYAAYTSK